MKNEELFNKYVYNEEGQIIDITTGEIIDKKEIVKAYQEHVSDVITNSNLDLIDIGENLGIRVVKDRRGNEYRSYNVKEGFHFVKVFKVDVRDMLESSKMSIISRGFIYSCLAYLHFPTNTLIFNGSTPTNEQICEKFMIGKTKLYEVLKELEKLEIIKRKKINGQTVIYINPFLHSSGLVDVETYNLFKDSVYNPIKD
jgi:hypothetical protein